MHRRSEPRQLTDRDLADLRTLRDRQARYLRTAHIIQSKWFILGGGLAIAVFLALVFLVG